MPIKKTALKIWDFDIYSWQNYDLKNRVESDAFKKSVFELEKFKKDSTVKTTACVLGHHQLNDETYIKYGYIVGGHEYVFCWQTYWDEFHRALSKGKSEFYDSLQQSVNFKINYNPKKPAQHFIAEKKLSPMNKNVIYLGSKSQSSKIKSQLIKELEKIKGLEDRPSKVAGGSAIFYNGKEIAHFHNDHEIDIRLTKKVIRQLGLTHPVTSKIHKHRSPSSEWIEIQFHKPEDVKEVVHLFKLALKQYRAKST